MKKALYNKKGQLIAYWDTELDSNGKAKGEVISGGRRSGANRVVEVNGCKVILGQVAKSGYVRIEETFETPEKAERYALNFITSIAPSFLSRNAFMEGTEKDWNR